MKKIYFVLIVPIIAIAVAFTTGPNAGYTGSPLDGKDCTDCHQGLPAVQVQNLIVIDVGLNGYIGGQTYPLTVICTDIASSKMGFQITSENAGGKLGTWIVTDITRTQLKSGTAVTHTSAGTTPSGTPNEWNMQWTAPPAGTGPVSFYVAINKSNANNQVIGDEIYVSSLTIQESGVGIAENLDQFVGTIYPNPAQEYIHVNAPKNSAISVYDLNGNKVQDHIATGSLMRMDVSLLPKGVYYLAISSENQLASRVFVKQ